MKKGNPDADFKEMSNILGAKWTNLSADEKKPYEERYQADKGSYQQIVGNEKREKEAMKLLEDEEKQRMAVELLEQYLQFKQVRVCTQTHPDDLKLVCWKKCLNSMKFSLIAGNG